MRNLKLLEILIKVFVILSCFVLCVFPVNAQEVDEIQQLNASFEKAVYSDFNQAKRLALEAVSKSENLLNDALLLESYSNLSEIYLQLKLIDSSLIYCNKGLPYAIKLNNLEKVAVLYNRKGIFARMHDDFKTSLEFHEKAFIIAKFNNLTHIESQINKNLSLLYRERRDVSAAFYMLQKAIDMSLLHGYQKILSESYNIKGLLFFNTHKDSALYYYNKALKIAKKDNDKSLEGILLSNIGDFYLNIGDNDRAIFCLEQAGRVLKHVGDNETLYYISVSLGIYNENIGDFDTAVKNYKAALNNKLLDKSQRKRAYWLLSGALWHNKQFEEAFDYQEKYIFLNDSIFNIEKEKEFETLRTQYEVEKKDNQIVLLEKENELADTRRIWIISSAILLTIPLIVLFLFYRHRAKTQKTIRLQNIKLHEKEKERLKEEQKLKATQALIEGQDIERERIAKELHDGVGGQLASINLSLSHVNSSIQNESITKINGSLKNTFKELRTLSHSLSDSHYKNKTFEALLFELKAKYEDSKLFNLEISIFPEHSLKQLDSHIKHHLYRIIQELLTNVVKHTKAELVELSFNKHEDVLIVTLEDDGAGFNVDNQKEGIGINNIKERTTSINATFSIDSVINKGTSVIIEIPILKNSFDEN